MGRLQRAVTGERNDTLAVTVLESVAGLTNSEETRIKDKVFMEQRGLSGLPGEAKPDRALGNGT